MHSLHRCLLTSLVLLVPACAANSADPSSDDDTATSAEMAITEDNPFQQLNDGNGDDITLDFVSGNRPNQNGGAMNARSKVAVTYDTSRLTKCGVSKNGAPSSAHLELGYRVAGGPAHTIALGTTWDGPAGSTKARATLPKLDASTSGTLELWFHATNGAGCEAWDSNVGANYPFLIHRGDVGNVTFGPDITKGPSAAGLPSGGLVRVTYDEARLPACASTGHHVIEMFYRFDGGAWHEKVQDIAAAGATFLPIGVPLHAHEMEAWFQSVDHPRGCFAYDSRFQANYALHLE